MNKKIPLLLVGVHCACAMKKPAGKRILYLTPILYNLDWSTELILLGEPVSKVPDQGAHAAPLGCTCLCQRKGRLLLFLADISLPPGTSCSA